MKNFIAGLILTGMLSLFSCTKVIYTHEQVVDSYKTKDQVVKKFGIPAEELINGEVVEWLYPYDKNNLPGNHSISEVESVRTAHVAEFTSYRRYIIFSMDKQGEVIRWKGEGVDLAEKQKDPGATVMLVIGGLGATALAVWGVSALAAASLENSFSW